MIWAGAFLTHSEPVMTTDSNSPHFGDSTKHKVSQMFRTHFSTIAFAAATDAGAAGKTTETAAPESTVVENVAIEPLKVTAQIEALSKAFDGQRNEYPTLDAAMAKLESINAAKETEGLFGLPVAVVGYDDSTGEVDPAFYEGSRAVLALVGARGIKTDVGKEANSFKAVVIFPIPTLASFLSATAEQLAAIPENVRAWLDKVIVKEASHVAFRNFRDANTMAELLNGAKAAPKSIDEYVTASSREGSGLDTDTFDALWGSFRTMLRKNQPALFDLLPQKPEVIKAIRSKAYAETQDETAALESKGVFQRIGEMLILGAKNNKDKDGNPAPLDESTLVDWLAGRDTLVITKEAPKAKDFSVLESLNW